ncbi:DUF1428 domain-containing protein [Legionella erythra]|uniref:RNA signal recognition particle 4.5S RNA n=1 Tax=Legionella erythra TaxID=448 RepID=A0A0W0TSF3_LEGER|nr:DUF1428 family protein [Legionella erythra]KTC98363.1 hypothetical protein Lery_0926 [Legionella erythra]
MDYVDGFVLPIPADKLKAYCNMAKSAGDIWMEHGALAFRECVIDDATAQGMVSFPEMARASASEVVIFSYIVFKSREHRDEVNKRVMADARIKKNIEEFGELFDCKRMAYGGFKTLVDL